MPPRTRTIRPSSIFNRRVSTAIHDSGVGPTLGALLATGFYLALKAIGYWRIDPDQDSTDTRHSAMHDTGFGTTGSRVGRPSDATFVDGGRGFNSNGPNVTAPAGTGKMYGGNAHTGTGIGSGPSPHASGLTGSQATYNPAGAGGGLGNTAAPGQSATPTYPSGAAAV